MRKPPLREAFKPLTRERCCSGTINEVEACMAAQWNIPPDERIIKMT